MGKRGPKANPKSCVVCGAIFFARRKTCSSECAQKAISNEVQKKTVFPKTALCEYCGIEFQKKRRGGPCKERKFRFCSRDCSFKAHGSQTPELIERQLKSKLARLIREHYAKEQRAWKRLSRPEPISRVYVPVSRIQVECLYCGRKHEAFERTHYPACSKRCRRKLEKWNRRGRIKNNKAGSRPDPFSPLVVFKRDNWTCQICGKKLSMLQRGSLMAEAPTIDHIVPLSKGGVHRISNCQCACRRCNSIKGTKIKETTVCGG